jgi:hypothetical protein
MKAKARWKCEQKFLTKTQKKYDEIKRKLEKNMFRDSLVKHGNKFETTGIFGVTTKISQLDLIGRFTFNIHFYKQTPFHPFNQPFNQYGV